MNEQSSVNDSLKIAIVCYPTFGGSGVVATELGLELAKRGHEIHFITYSQPVRLGLLNKNIFFHEVHVPEYPLFHYQPYELALSSKLVDMVKQYQINLLHVHYAIPHAYAGYMAKMVLKDQGVDLPMVTTLHGTDITLVGNHPNYQSAVNFSINHSDAVTCVSESLKQDTYHYFNIEKSIEVIPNFIDLNKSKSSHSTTCKRSLIADDNQRIITHISNFRPVKRVLDVVRIFHQVQKQLPAKLMMVGDGPDKERAEDLCQELGISDRVIFFGKSSDIGQILCYSDLFLLPSETESFGLAALEAMSYGIPVISSNTGGLPEVNKDQFSGYLANVTDVDTMKKRAIELLSNSSKLSKFKKQAIEQASLFDVKKIVSLYEGLYFKLLAGC